MFEKETNNPVRGTLEQNDGFKRQRAFPDTENSYICNLQGLEYDGTCYEYAADVLLYRPGRITFNGEGTVTKITGGAE